MKCEYDYSYITSISGSDGNAHSNTAPSYLIASSTLLEGLLTSSTIQSPGCSSQSPSSASQGPNSSALSASVAVEVLNLIVANGEPIPSMTATYFRTIGGWLPILNPEQIESGLRFEASLDFATLLLCMRLVTLMPGSHGGPEAMKNQTYFQTKALFSLRSSSGELSLEIVQAGILLCLYEIGHGMSDAAQVSISVVSRYVLVSIALRIKI